jgi:hypothetical protein
MSAHHRERELLGLGDAIVAGLYPGWFYVGRRPSATEVFVVSAARVDPLAHRAHRSVRPFDWGGGAQPPGRLELAYALLADATGQRPPEAATRALDRQVVRHLPSDGFVLSDVELDVWLHREGHDPLRWGRGGDGEAP